MACKLKSILQNDLLHIQNCSCGLVHLHFGPFSMRIPESDLNLLIRSLSKAEEKMLQPAKQPVAAPQRFQKKMIFRVE